jgi:hypothetical protein
MSVLEAIFSFDGTHVGDLRDAVAGFDPSDGPVVIALCSSDEPSRRMAATWVVKSVLDRGLDPGLDVSVCFARLAVETEPGAVLHILQLAQHAPDAAGQYRTEVEALLNHDSLLVAVWALDASVRIALETQDGIDIARARVDAAFSHEKASMRARARHLARILDL